MLLQQRAVLSNLQGLVAQLDPGVGLLFYSPIERPSREARALASSVHESSYMT